MRTKQKPAELGWPPMSAQLYSDLHYQLTVGLYALFVYKKLASVSDNTESCKV